MKALRYIITRPCLQEGSLRLLKYLDAAFPSAGPVTLVDDRGQEHAAQVDRERGRVWGLGGLYHAQNLNVNDVLMLTLLAPGRYQVEAIVKPHAAPAAPRREVAVPAETRRVVVASTPHVREVRMQAVRPPHAAPAAPRPAEPEASPAPAAEAPRGPTSTRPGGGARPAETPVRPLDVRFPEPVAPARAAERSAPAERPLPSGVEAQLDELARLTGYRLEDLGGGVTRLKAELGPHGYAVLIARDAAAMAGPGWQEGADHRLVLQGEDERAGDTPRLTREALLALIEHARLAPITPVDLRGYWKAGSLDLESAASIAELVSAHLAQRGAFSFVLLTLAQQPAHSVVSVQRLAERLGSGVNYAELGSILDTLSRAPFLALTPLPGGQYLLRVGMGDLLADLAQYAEGVRRRVRTPAGKEPALT